jgi:glycosyltransferase involved in cell wall biosynthesis
MHCTTHGKLLPKISIIIPSFNQGQFLERTLQSIIQQNYYNIEIIVMDGGSTDESCSIINKYSKFIAKSVSEPDLGQSHAINKGIYISTGDIVGWLNSDDTLAPNSLKHIAKACINNPTAGLFYGHSCLISSNDTVIKKLPSKQYTHFELKKFSQNLICQPGTFWRNKRPFGRQYDLDESLIYAMDIEFWLRISSHENILFVNAHLGNLRIHEYTKTSRRSPAMKAEIGQVIATWGGDYRNKPIFYLWSIYRKITIVLNPKTFYFLFIY